MAIKILIGDVFEQLKALPDESIDCIVTSPPYWGLRDYGMPGQLGMESSLGLHIETMVRVFRELRRVLKKTGTCWLNYGDCYAATPNGRSASDTKKLGRDDRTFRDKPFSTIGPIDKSKRIARGKGRWGGGQNPAGGYLKNKDLCMIPNRMAIALQDDGWWVRSEIIWDKPNPMPESVTDRPATAHEKIFLLTKSAKYFYDYQAVRTPMKESTIARLSQDVDAQAGSARANGGAKTNGPMKAVGGWQSGKGSHSTLDHNRHDKKRGKADKTPRKDGDRWNNNNGRGFAPIGEKQRGHSRRHAGFNERWDVMPRGEQMANGANLKNVWRLPTRGFREAHFATFPPELPEICIKAGCPVGGVVLDPFGGSGTTALVADRLGREAVLIELNPDYVQMSENRVYNDAPLLVKVSTEGKPHAKPKGKPKPKRISK